MVTSKKIIYFFSAVLLIACVVFFFVGFDKISNYHNSESYFSTDKNAYVGGDAYNYIINGTYFTGYMVLCIGCLISSIILFATARFAAFKEKQNDNPIVVSSTLNND